ncbi:MAG: hypothetical protein MJK04_32545 [Psychrosphaera sp.]|nr:hypothetical protein [Psychrosphaera sp.]
MYQTHLNHPSNQAAQPLDPAVYQSMFHLFEHICLFWQNLDNPKEYKSRLFVFMDNRMRLRPEYRQHYIVAKQTMDELIEMMGEQPAYELLFTDKDAYQGDPDTPLAVTRQKVSNEFITFQISQGGFKTFGGENSLGYIGGAYIQDEPIPYRSFKE